MNQPEIESSIQELVNESKITNSLLNEIFKLLQQIEKNTNGVKTNTNDIWNESADIKTLLKTISKKIE